MQTRRQDEARRRFARHTFGSGCILAPGDSKFEVSSEPLSCTLGDDGSATSHDGDEGHRSDNQIVVYQPNDTVWLDVRLEFAADIKTFNVQCPRLEVHYSETFHRTPYRRR